jgi:hypothetical protein
MNLVDLVPETELCPMPTVVAGSNIIVIKVFCHFIACHFIGLRAGVYGNNDKIIIS